MTATSSPIAEPLNPPIQGRPAGASPQAPAIDRHDLRRRLLTVLVLSVCVATVLLAVPDLRPVLWQIADMNPGLVAAAVALELASCLSFVVIFRLFFRSIPKSAAREMAWSQMGSGALLPGGGVGSLAVGGWLLHVAGMPIREIVQRSSGLFFLTSAINVITLAAASLLLLLGIGAGPHDLLRAGLPVLAAVAAIILVLGLPKATRRVAGAHPRVGWVADVGVGIPAARHALVRPSWRLLGAAGYLLFDIAVLWTTFAAVGPLPPLVPLIVAYLVGYLPNVLPIPGGIGVLDAGLVGALALYGSPVSHAAAAVLVYHAIAFWVPTLGGMLAYARLRPRLAPTDEEVTPLRGPELVIAPVAPGSVAPGLSRRRSRPFAQRSGRPQVPEPPGGAGSPRPAARSSGHPTGAEVWNASRAPRQTEPIPARQAGGGSRPGTVNAHDDHSSQEQATG